MKNIQNLLTSFLCLFMGGYNLSRVINEGGLTVIIYFVIFSFLTIINLYFFFKENWEVKNEK